jgi:hypothetical protein
MTQTLKQIRQEGLAALRERLGRAGMIRLLQPFETGRGDHACERHAWTDETSLDDLRSRAKRQSRSDGVPRS